MNTPVIAYENVQGNVVLEGEYKYSSNMTIGLSDGGDFYLKIIFRNLDINDFEVLANLGKLQRRLKMESDLIAKEKLNITHIVVTNIQATSAMEIIWECLSDDPSLYEGME